MFPQLVILFFGFFMSVHRRQNDDHEPCQSQKRSSFFYNENGKIKDLAQASSKFSTFKALRGTSLSAF
jgi:hypothetical protein